MRGFGFQIMCLPSSFDKNYYFPPQLPPIPTHNLVTWAVHNLRSQRDPLQICSMPWFSVRIFFKQALLNTDLIFPVTMEDSPCSPNSTHCSSQAAAVQVTAHASGGSNHVYHVFSSAVYSPGEVCEVTRGRMLYLCQE